VSVHCREIAFGTECDTGSRANHAKRNHPRNDGTYRQSAINYTGADAGSGE